VVDRHHRETVDLDIDDNGRLAEGEFFRATITDAIFR